MSDVEIETPDSPWHRGEIALQTHIGAAEKMAFVGTRALRDHMPEQHQAFYAQLPFVVAGLVDPAGQVWATMLCGQPGFMTALSPTTLSIQGTPDESDPALAGFQSGSPIGLLGIEPETRRRNRANGQIDIQPNGFHLAIQQTMGNCPKYISTRQYNWTERATPQIAETLTTLDAGAIEAIQSADTFFVASYLEDKMDKKADVSHRGGKPGFVRVNADGSLTIPDFSGNLFFNTLGNILLNGKAGLIFPNFETGDVLQMTGNAEILLDSPEIETFEGAQRLWVFKPEKIVRRSAALPFSWTYMENSPFNAATGQW